MLKLKVVFSICMLKCHCMFHLGLFTVYPFFRYMYWDYSCSHTMPRQLWQCKTPKHKWVVFTTDLSIGGVTVSHYFINGFQNSDPPLAFLASRQVVFIVLETSTAWKPHEWQLKIGNNSSYDKQQQYHGLSRYHLPT